MQRLLGCLSLLLSASLMADDLVVSITPPTTWSDGSPVQASDVSAYGIAYDCEGQGKSVIIDKLTHTFTGVPDGECDITVYAIDRRGVQGESTVVSVTTGLSLSAPGAKVGVHQDTSLSAVIEACDASPTCTALIISP